MHGSTQRQLATALAFRSGCLTAPELLPSWVPRVSVCGTASAPSLFPVLYGYTIPHRAAYVKPTFRRVTSKFDYTQYNKQIKSRGLAPSACLLVNVFAVCDSPVSRLKTFSVACVLETIAANPTFFICCLVDNFVFVHCNNSLLI